jgi:hypothetical protein
MSNNSHSSLAAASALIASCVFAVVHPDAAHLLAACVGESPRHACSAVGYIES